MSITSDEPYVIYEGSKRYPRIKRDAKDFSLVSSKTKLDDFAQRRLLNFIQEKDIKQQQLLTLAMKFPAQTMKNLIGSGILNGIA